MLRHQRPPLSRCCAQGRLEVARLLLTWPSGTAPKADCNNSAGLIIAANNGHPELVRLLITHISHAPRADINGSMALMQVGTGGPLIAFINFVIVKSVLAVVIGLPARPCGCGGGPPRSAQRDRVPR